MFKNDWSKMLENEVNSTYFAELMKKIDNLYEEKEIYPKKDEIFNAFNLTSYENTKVVILGQDPYHGEGEAHGLAFSVMDGVKIPPSLRNIYKEIANEFETQVTRNGNLTYLANQGVLLLNSTLTVEKDQANSHKSLNWSRFTDGVIKILNEKEEPLVFMLWGNFAIKKAEFITNDRHLVLKSAHPSPLSASRGFFGNNHFLEANKFLLGNHKKEINWN